MTSMATHSTAGTGAHPRSLPVGGKPAAPARTDGSRLIALLVAVIAVLVTAGCMPTAGTGQRPEPGEYTVAVTLTGGSGKASVSSPAKLVVTADGMTAEVVWSSPHYTWLRLDGTTYQPVNPAGENSTFVIPVKLDADLPIAAETTAMSRPHTIEYTLRFDSASVAKA